MTQTPRYASPAGLQTLFGLPEDVRAEILRGAVVLESLSIDQWAWADHNGSLCTLGAGPCLNVVVHNASVPTARGCLAHVRNHHISQQKIYQTACKTIYQMVTTARTADTDVLDIWFGSGYAFYPGSPKIKQGPVAETFAQFLQAFLATQGVDPGTVRINEQCLRTESRGIEQADGYDPGDVVYLPARQSVFILNSAERRLLTEQCPNALQRASRLQMIELIF